MFQVKSMQNMQNGMRKRNNDNNGAITKGWNKNQNRNNDNCTIIQNVQNGDGEKNVQ